MENRNDTEMTEWGNIETNNNKLLNRERINLSQDQYEKIKSSLSIAISNTDDMSSKIVITSDNPEVWLEFKVGNEIKILGISTLDLYRDYFLIAFSHENL